MTLQTVIIHHVLPDEPVGDTTWFSRQKPFEQQEVLRQVGFKRRVWPEIGDGRLSKHPEHIYPHILPDGEIRKAFYPPLADAILLEFEESKIALHSEALNLKSSQVACLNFLYPFKQDLTLAAKAFATIMPGMDYVSGLEFEFTGSDDAVRWMGEPRAGRRGQNRTSIDAAVFWQDKRGCRRVTLIEWKYTERNFGECSAHHSASADERFLCEVMNVATEPNPEARCLLTTGRRHRTRRYWEHLEDAGIRLSAFAGVQGCPFQGPLYQLMRQFLLGYYLKSAGEVDEYEIVSNGFAGNTSLAQVPVQLQPLAKNPDATILDVWNQALADAPLMRHIVVDEWMKSIEHLDGVDPA